MSRRTERKAVKAKAALSLEKVVFLIVAVAVLVGITTYYLASRKGTEETDLLEQDAGIPDPEVAALIERFQKNPEDTAAMVRLGNHYYDTGNYPMAEMFYKRYLEVNPHNVNVIVDLGTVYYYTNRGEEAAKRYQDALAIDPDHKNALFNMGIAKDAMGDREGAVLWWHRFLEVAGDDPHAEPIREMIAEYEGEHKEGGKTP